MAEHLATVTALPVWRRCVPDQSALRAPGDLIARLDSGECLVLMGRCSSSGGKEGRRAAVDDLYGAADLLVRQAGIDVRPFLPEKETLRDQLKAATSENSTTADGRSFRNRYAVIDLRSRAGVVFLVSTGSGHLLDEDGEQPFVRYAARVIRRHDAALFCCKRLDRGAREDWGVAPLMIALRQRDGFLCDEDGLGEIDQVRGFLSFMKGSGSRKLASDLPFQTRSGQVSRSETELVGGQARYHLPTPPPPGFGVCWLRGAGTTPTEKVLFLDADGARPDDSLVAFGLPEIYRDVTTDGTGTEAGRVDQVENVRFVLSVLGKPSWSKKRIVAELAARKFSTVGLRMNNEVSTTLPNDPVRGRAVLKSITDNLDVYESGVLRRNIGAGIDPLEITGCWPLDGRGWATDEDFSRIRSYLREADDRISRSTQLAFAGTKATFNGQAVRMISYARAGRAGAGTQLAYRFLLEASYPSHQHAPDGPMVLPSEPWAQSVVDGIARAGEVPLKLAETMDLADAGDERLNQLRAEELALRQEIDAGESRLDALEARLEQTDGNGELVLQGALLRRLQTQYNELAEDTLPTLRQRLERAQNELQDLQAKQPESAAAALVLELVESLRDPRDRRFRAVWLTSLHNVQFTSEPFQRDGAKGRRLRWNGAIRITDGEDTFLIPFQGEHETGAASRVAGRRRSQADRLVEAMLDGTPYTLADVADKRRAYRAVVEALGADPERFLLSACDDPRITRVATHCYLHRDRSDGELATELGVEEALMRQVREVHVEATEGPTFWQTDRTAAEIAMYVVAARNDGSATAGEVNALAGGSLGQIYNVASRLRAETVLWSTRRKRGYELLPCACGSFARAPMRIPEVCGPVCLGCRRDLAGVEWPADPYDRYIAQPHLWAGEADEGL